MQRATTEGSRSVFLDTQVKKKENYTDRLAVNFTSVLETGT